MNTDLKSRIRHQDDHGVRRPIAVDRTTNRDALAGAGGTTTTRFDRTIVDQPTGLAGRYQRTPLVVAAEVVAGVGLAATAYIHLAEMSEKFAEVPYIGVGYVLLSIACVASIVMITARRTAGWYLGGLTCALTFIGYVLTRTVGLPGSTEDIGNWSEIMGTWSLIAEGTVVAVTAAMIATRFGHRPAR